MESYWAELPRELLREIMKKLSIASILSCKLVCRNWQSVVSEDADLSVLRPVPSPPWVTLPYRETSRASLYDLTNRKVYLCDRQWIISGEHVSICVGSCHGWLAYVDDLCVIYLSNPFKHGDESTIGLPSIKTLPGILGSSLGSPWPHYTYLSNHYTGATRTDPSWELFRHLITKMVMSTPPFDRNCVVMAIFNIGQSKRIAFCKLGDTSWKTLEGNPRSYADLYHSSDNQRFYALHRDTWSIDVLEFHESSSSVTCIRIETAKSEIYHYPSMPNDELERFLCIVKSFYLLELNGEILLVVKYIGSVTEDGKIYNWHEALQDLNGTESINFDELSRKTFCFEVYKLDSEKKEWGLVNCLGNEGEYAAFVGVNNAVAFSVRDFPKLECNSVYFTREDYEYETRKSGTDYDYDLGIFSFRDNKINRIYYLHDHMKNFTPLVWTSPNLC